MSSTNSEQEQPEKAKEVPASTTSKPAEKTGNNTTKNPIMMLVIVLAVIIIAFLLFQALFGGGSSGKVGDTSLNGIKTYYSKSGSDEDKKAQSTFKVGDPIQVGFTYDGGEETDSLVKFVVFNNENDEKMFATNLFRLNPESEELFVSINNTSLPAGDYNVTLKDNEGNEVAKLDYKIEE